MMREVKDMALPRFSKSGRCWGLVTWLCLGMVWLCLALMPRPVWAASGNIMINNGDTNTSSPTVTLALYGLYGVSLVRFSNDFNDDRANWSAWEAPPPYDNPYKTWTLSDGDGDKIVYAQFSGLGSNTETNDSIFLDANGPTGSITINNGATYTNNPTLSLTFTATH